jgi:hypothetical protein
MYDGRVDMMILLEHANLRQGQIGSLDTSLVRQIVLQVFILNP